MRQAQAAAFDFAVAAVEEMEMLLLFGYCNCAIDRSGYGMWKKAEFRNGVDANERETKVAEMWENKCAGREGDREGDLSDDLLD
jgi:hypothetical protein